MRCGDGEERRFVVLFRRLCHGGPLLVLGFAAEAVSLVDSITVDLDATIERIETVVVEVVDPVPRGTHDALSDARLA
jgi:hypothetical protein